MSLIINMLFFGFLVVLYLVGLRSLLARPPTREEEMIKYLRRSSKEDKPWKNLVKEKEKVIRRKMIKYYR